MQKGEGLVIGMSYDFFVCLVDMFFVNLKVRVNPAVGCVHCAEAGLNLIEAVSETVDVIGCAHGTASLIGYEVRLSQLPLARFSFAGELNARSEHVKKLLREEAFLCRYGEL